jgi:uncharacterized protein YukE
MGKLTEALKKLEIERKTFTALTDTWQKETQLFAAAYDTWAKKMGELTKIDDAILRTIKDNAEKTRQSEALGDARGKKLPQPSTIKASDAQRDAFKGCDEFTKSIENCGAVLKVYDTKGKPTKEQKKVEAQKLLLQAKLDLAEVKKSKVNYEYQSEDTAQYADVLKAIAKVDSLKKKLTDMATKLKNDVAIVDDAK